MRNLKDIAILVSTSDASEDLWKPLEETYNRFWLDREFPIYLTTNFKSPLFDSFSPLAVGSEISWSDNLLKSLKRVEQRYVLLTFDDLFLIDKVNNNKIKELMQFAIDEDINYLQFYRSISKGRRINEKLFKKSKNAKYKNSTIWSFWKKEVLISLLRKEENAWEFEINGSIRAAKLDDFYSTRSNVFPFVNGVVKGFWNPSAKNRIQNLGIHLCENRKSLSSFEKIKYQLIDFHFNVYTFILHLIY